MGSRRKRRTKPHASTHDTCSFILTSSYNIATYQLKVLAGKLPSSTRVSFAFFLGPTGYGCNFETNFCTWTKDASAPFNWTRHQGSTSSLDTGPASDHTLKNCKFRYLSYLLNRDWSSRKVFPLHYSCKFDSCWGQPRNHHVAFAWWQEPIAWQPGAQTDSQPRQPAQTDRQPSDRQRLPFLSASMSYLS